MKFPFIVEANLNEQQLRNFEERFCSTDLWDYSLRENVWRRHQAEENRDLSGWTPGSARRRLVYFRDHYGLVNGDFCLKNTYLFLTVTLPSYEIASYNDLLWKNLHEGGWSGEGHEWARGGLKVTISSSLLHKMEFKYGFENPKGYLTLDVTITNLQSIEDEIREKPWKIFKTGIRPQVPRGNPTIINKEELSDFFPAQVELGCGPSIEAGIPPLNYFHDLFSIHEEGKFIFSAAKDTFLNVIRDPEGWYRKSTEMARRSLNAQPTQFYHWLKTLADEGKIVGPILNNNFDALPRSVGLEEFPLRQFDQDGVYPGIDFHPAAKSLLVIGSHADRRKCQYHARQKGLKIVFIDPEGYETPDGFSSYPIESPQDQDFLLRLKSTDLA